MDMAVKWSKSGSQPRSRGYSGRRGNLTVTGQGVNQVEGMCLGGGIYSVNSVDEYTEVKKRKMPRVRKWTSLPGVECASVKHCCPVSSSNSSVKGMCIGSVHTLETKVVKERAGYELVEVNVDSGAIDSCIPPNIANQFKTRSTKMSENGGYYTSASGGVIYNEGERDVKGITDDSQELGMTFQVAKVRGPLGSVRRICEAGNRVVFDEDGSYIENKVSKKRVNIDKVKGVYMLKLWVKRQESLGVNSVNGFANSNSSFARLGQLI